jgi:hypothetical protein
MIKSGEGQGFAAETPPRILVSEHPGRKDFDSDVAVELLIMRAIYYTHPARANLLKNAVVAKDVADDGL